MVLPSGNCFGNDASESNRLPLSDVIVASVTDDRQVALHEEDIQSDCDVLDSVLGVDRLHGLELLLSLRSTVNEIDFLLELKLCLGNDMLCELSVAAWVFQRASFRFLGIIDPGSDIEPEHHVSIRETLDGPGLCWHRCEATLVLDGNWRCSHRCDHRDHENPSEHWCWRHSPGGRVYLHDCEDTKCLWREQHERTFIAQDGFDVSEQSHKMRRVRRFTHHDLVRFQDGTMMKSVHQSGSVIPVVSSPVDQISPDPGSLPHVVSTERQSLHESEVQQTIQ